jgi:hypothetical protein
MLLLIVLSVIFICGRSVGGAKPEEKDTGSQSEVNCLDACIVHREYKLSLEPRVDVKARNVDKTPGLPTESDRQKANGI